MGGVLMWKPTLKEFSNEYFAVFNTRTKLEEQAVAITTSVYGKEEVEKKLKPIIKDGVMGVFKVKPNEVSLFFVLTLSKMTDNFHKKKKAKK